VTPFEFWDDHGIVPFLQPPLSAEENSRHHDVWSKVDKLSQQFQKCAQFEVLNSLMTTVFNIYYPRGTLKVSDVGVIM